MQSPVRSTRIAAALAIAGVLAIGVAVARPDGGAMFDRLDSDASGTVSSAELAAHKARALEGLDADGDGIVAFEEMQAQRERQREQRARARFARLDADADGQVSVEEFAARGAKRGAHLLERLDADADGEISREEFRAAAGRHGRRHHGGRHDG